MPGKFTNISNLGRAKFSNISNSGRGYFFDSNTTTSTTTTTTTLTQVYYQLEQCYSLTTAYSINYNINTFNYNDIVLYGTNLYFRVVASSSIDPGGIKYSVSSTGLSSCPSTTTTTTTTTIAPITFTLTTNCSGNTSQITASNFSGGSGTYSYIASGSSEANAITAIQNAGTRYTITGASYKFTSLANSTTFYITVMDSTGAFPTPISITTPNCTTTTSTTTTTTTVSLAINIATGTAGTTGTACSRAQTNIFIATVYNNLYYTSLVDGATYYTDQTFLTPYNGGGSTYSDGVSYGTINSSGVFTFGGSCSA